MDGAARSLAGPPNHGQLNPELFGLYQQPTETTAEINGGLDDKESMSWSASQAPKGAGNLS